MLRATIADLKSRHAAFDAWVNRHWPVLSTLGYALAFAVTFGGAALSAYHSGFTATSAAVCGVLFILFVRLCARSIPSAQRLIDRLHPEPDAPARPDEIPGWAAGVYLLAGFVVVVAFGALQESDTIAPVELFAAWAVGRNLLDLFRQKHDGTTARRHSARRSTPSIGGSTIGPRGISRSSASCALFSGSCCCPAASRSMPLNPASRISQRRHAARNASPFRASGISRPPLAAPAPFSSSRSMRG
jgi:hypothetical protein